MTEETQKEWLRQMAEERQRDDEERRYHWSLVARDWAEAKAKTPPQEMLKISQPKVTLKTKYTPEMHTTLKLVKLENALWVRVKWFLWRWLTR